MRKCSRCGKDKHPSSLSAIRSALRASKKRGTPLRTYHDPVCNHWALTSKPKFQKEEAA